MLSERLLTNVVRQCTNQYLKLKPTDEVMMCLPNFCFSSAVPLMTQLSPSEPPEVNRISPG